jgi:hypothetical protein
MRAIVLTLVASVLGVAAGPAPALASKNRPAPRHASAGVRMPQKEFATLTGETTTATGARLPNHKVRLRHVSTGKVTAETVSNGSAAFAFTEVAPAQYLLEIVNAAGQVIGVSSVIPVSAGSTVFVTIAAKAAGAIAAASGGVSLFGLGSTASAAVLAAAGAVAATAVIVTRREASVSR